jgi:LAO/AO transport system kinase
MIQKRLSPEAYVKGVLNNDKMVLGRAITLIESNQPQDQELSSKIMERLMPETGNSVRIGITGIPGVGKSTFIEAFGTYLTQDQGKSLAVLAIDPSSQLSKGSILGDKTRMERLATNKKAFIRPSPTGQTLGGVAAKSREVTLLCEAAGYEVVLVETVGVGQSETAVRGMVDLFMLLMIAGTGDDLQGIKRGILEMADMIAINKADGDNIKKADEARKQLKMALHMYPPAESGQNIPVMTCSSLEETGIDNIWSEINKYVAATQASGYFNQRRKVQNISWMHEFITSTLSSEFYQREEVKQRIKDLEVKVEEGLISPQQAGRLLLDTI